jgi:hypothetical protein
VVAHCGSRVGVRRCLLDVAQWDAGVEGGGDESVSECVRPTLVDACSLGDSPHDPRCCVPVETLAVVAEQDRSVEPVTGGKVDGSSGSRRHRHDDGLAAFA